MLGLGTTYWDRNEIHHTHSTHEPLFVKKTMIYACFAKADKIKEIEKKIQKDIAAKVVKEKAGPNPEFDSMVTYIYTKDTSGGRIEKDVLAAMEIMWIDTVLQNQTANV